MNNPGRTPGGKPDRKQHSEATCDVVESAPAGAVNGIQHGIGCRSVGVMAAHFPTGKRSGLAWRGRGTRRRRTSGREGIIVKNWLGPIIGIALAAVIVFGVGPWLGWW